MPKAPRDKESTAPKKQSRKTAPQPTNGVHGENGNGLLAKSAVVSTAAGNNHQSSPNVEEQIRRRAYELYMERGGHGGSPEQDWLRAQEEISARRRSA